MFEQNRSSGEGKVSVQPVDDASFSVEKKKREKCLMFAFSSVLLCGCEALAQSAPPQKKSTEIRYKARGERPALVGVRSHIPDLTELSNPTSLFDHQFYIFCCLRLRSRLGTATAGLALRQMEVIKDVNSKRYG